MPNCCIIGSGVIGLSIARELAGRGLSVTVVSRDPPQALASWAAGGIFPAQPPGDSLPPTATPLEQFTFVSDRLHSEWARQLRDETGIDTGLRRCGTLAIATSDDTSEELSADMRRWQRLGVRHQPIATKDLADCEPAVAAAVAAGTIREAVLLPDEVQIRPPRHLAALRASCQHRGVEFLDAVSVTGLQTANGRIEALATDDSTRPILTADQFCITAGAWSEKLLTPLGLHIPTRPWRGQILLQRTAPGFLRRVINIGAGFDYLIPRPDGRLLVGSTIEDAGFDASTTQTELTRLALLLQSLLPKVSFGPPEASWAALRPGTPDGLPVLGQLPGIANGWLATGHYRAGLHLSPATAVVMADSICGEPARHAFEAFSPERLLAPDGLLPH